MEHFLSNLLNPKSIAFLGASNNILTMGTGQLYTLKSRFKGAIYPIHPKEETVLGFKAYKSVDDLPEVPDLLVIVLPTRLVEEYLEKAGKFGIPYAVIVSAGFGEVGESAAQERLNTIAKRYNMRFIGPNCIGIINTHAKNGIVNCTWFPFELPEGQTGNISMVSQSGSWISQILTWAERRGVRLGKALSIGNEANVSITDCLRYFDQDSESKVIAMYIEGVKKGGREFYKALTKLARKKPVVVNYVGGTIAGSRAGMSHTASLGGRPTVYETIFKQAGVVRASTMEEMFEFSHAFSMAYPPKGDKIGLITNSGGPAVTLADSCERNGLKVPAFSKGLQLKIKELIPKMASANNPVDLTFDMNFNLFYQEIPKLIWESGEVDALIFYGLFGSSMMERNLKFGNNEDEDIFPLEAMEYILHENLTNFIDWIHTEKIPVLISCIDTADRAVVTLQNNNIPVFKWPSTTVKAMKALIQYYVK
ncbi:MAG: acetate--CoA ligase family protein [Candidatus Hodarchaeales archaeon]